MGNSGNLPAGKPADLIPEGTLPTRGERNNNPGNLNYMPKGEFAGQCGPEDPPPGAKLARWSPRFGKYLTAPFGIRAMAKLLLNYQLRDGLRTPEAWVGRYAPVADGNNERAYRAHVAQVMTDLLGRPVAVDTRLDLLDPAVHQAAVTAFIEHENGRCLYPADVIAAACNSARGSVRDPDSLEA